MRTAGFFRELSPTASTAYTGSIFDAVEDRPLDDVEQVAGYLRSGHGLIDTMEASADVFGSGRYIAGGSSLLTDGDWLWREDLEFYVTNHRVGLPPDFLRLIRKRGYRVPDLDRDRIRAAGEEAERMLGYR